jgi:hypothetical protein
LRQLTCEGWENVGFAENGISANFVSPDDLMNPGPAAEIDGVRYPVFFLRDEFEKFVRLAFGSAESPPDVPDSGAPLRRRGRQKGQGSFEVVDLPILNEMKDLISARKAASPEEAARVLADKAHGAGTIESKSARLAKRYRKRRP